MAKRVKRVGHPTATAQTFVGREREITIDTTVGISIVHNGVTPGGIRSAREDLSNAPDATPTSDGKATAAQISQINQNETDIAGLTNQLNNLMAVSVGFDPASSSLTSTNVQTAIDELDGKFEGLSLSADNISYDNTTSGLAAANVQDAIDELKAYIDTQIGNLGSAASLNKNQLKDYAFDGTTKAVFAQASAPTYWALDAANNDRVLRINTGGGGGTGGDWTISGITVDGHAITIDEIAPHSHGERGADNVPGGSTWTVRAQQTGNADRGTASNTESVGGGQPHSHGLTIGNTWRPAYLDIIICTKDNPTQ